MPIPPFGTPYFTNDTPTLLTGQYPGGVSHVFTVTQCNPVFHYNGYAGRGVDDTDVAYGSIYWAGDDTTFLGNQAPVGNTEVLDTTFVQARGAGPFSINTYAQFSIFGGKTDHTTQGVAGTGTVTVTCPAILLDGEPTNLPSGTTDTVYPPLTFSASGGTAPYTYAIYSGSLPPGMSLSSVGVLSGTPTGILTETTYVFTIRTQDAFPTSACLTVGVYSVVIRPAGGGGGAPPVGTGDGCSTSVAAGGDSGGGSGCADAVDPGSDSGGGSGCQDTL